MRPRISAYAIGCLLAGCLATSVNGATTGAPVCPPCGANEHCVFDNAGPHCACYDGYKTCPTADGGFVCSDLEIDDQDCGECGMVCGPGEKCQGGTCACQLQITCILDAGCFCGGTPNCDLCTPDSAAVGCCGSTCVDFQNDPDNCGACSNYCTEYGFCYQGKCKCGGDFVQCPPDSGILCLDGQSDSNNCGACGNACPQGAICELGHCVCDKSAGLATCAADGGQVTCADLSSDADNCGACGYACPAPEVCAYAICDCQPSTTVAKCETDAGLVCVDLLALGDAGNPCVPGSPCFDGGCGDGACCPRGCSDLSQDPFNCGACGYVCDSGVCLPNDAGAGACR